MKLLFVCSGNICRSPMAEGLAETMGARRGIDVVARSAGTLGIHERTADAKAIRVCRSIGVDISAHRSQGVSADLVRWADHVLVMEYAHAAHLREFFPEVGDKLLMMGTFVGVAEIADPIGGWTWRFRRTRRQLEKALEAFFQRVG